MSTTGTTAPALQRMTGFWRHGRWRPGVQLAIAVAVAWLVSMALHLPESFWAVMSVLIVMRPSAGSTLDAGWDRVRGTAIGALCGIAGVYLQHHGAPVLPTTLGVVILLAFASAAAPGLRSAPVAALIILSAGGIPGHSALQVALLRMVQIGIGVGVALAISTVASEYHAGPRFDEGCAALLHGIARRTAALAGAARPAEAETERANAAIRAALVRLTILAGSADLEARWWRRAATAGESRAYRNKARLAARIFQDAVVLDRLFRRVPDPGADPVWHEASEAASAAVASMANALQGKGTADLSVLDRVATRHQGHLQRAGATASNALLAAPLCLLHDDLQRMQRCIAA
ncbi:aromatic acid exporter family protein [Variovorax sp. VaC1]|uniref:FUSC family protein n=1 Tax=Variovorax sp. VaC1 TaxID=3373132 RepID=UPI003749E4FB